jgi:hypothetical protein
MPPPGDAGGVCSAARRGRGAGDGERAVRGRFRASEMMSMVPSSQERLRRCVPLALALALGALILDESSTLPSQSHFAATSSQGSPISKRAALSTFLYNCIFSHFASALPKQSNKGSSSKEE